MHVAIIGCGQLARMLALAGWNMGLEFSFLASPDESSDCVRGLGRVAQRKPGDNAQQIYIALGEPDVITVEREHVDTRLLQELRSYCRVYPEPESVHLCQDRLREKALFSTLQLPTAPYRSAQNTQEVADAANALGLPVVIKASTEGYDGKHQAHVHDQAQLQEFCMLHQEGNWLVESHINFDKEISFLAARSSNGDVALYPATENHHLDGILLTSVAPATGVTADIVGDGYQYIRILLDRMDYVGVLAMECFVTDRGLLINELAPRVHNSGHWTLRSEATSQFENHLRAILGMQLGSTAISGYDGIINILGSYNQAQTLHHLSPDSGLVDYNKSDGPRRKLGHINVSRNSHDDLLEELGRLHIHLYGDTDKHCYSNSGPALPGPITENYSKDINRYAT